MKILCTGDLHIISKNTRARTDNLAKAQRKKLTEISKIAVEEGVNVICCPGDVFDYPYQSYDTFVWAYRWFYSLTQRGIQPMVVYGQHDLFHHRLGSAEKTALYALTQLCNIYILGAAPVVYNGVAVYGASYSEEIPEGLDYIKHNHRYKYMLVCHKMVLRKSPYPTAKEGTDYISTKAIDGVYDFVLTGDWHGDFIHKTKHTTFVNPGALIRKTGDVVDYYREPKIAIWNTENNRVKSIPLQTALPAEQVLTREHIESVEVATDRMDEFIDRFTSVKSKSDPDYIKNLLRKLKVLKRQHKIDDRVERVILEKLATSKFRRYLKEEV